MIIKLLTQIDLVLLANRYDESACQTSWVIVGKELHHIGEGGCGLAIGQGQGDAVREVGVPGLLVRDYEGLCSGICYCKYGWWGDGGGDSSRTIRVEIWIGRSVRTCLVNVILRNLCEGVPLVHLYFFRRRWNDLKDVVICTIW